MLRQLLQRFKPAAPASDGRYRHGNSHLLELRQLIKHYPGPDGDIPALKGINLQIDRGEFVAVLGKSGSGKSTLMNMITGIDRPTSGEILIGDSAVHTLSEEEMTIWRGNNVGIVFQSFQLLPTLTVLENVMLPMDLCDAYSVKEFRGRALHLLAQVEMAEHANKLPSATSGGQQQRVAIARALANDPQLIVADEPTGSLDSQTADMVISIFERLGAEGKTILMVTHDRELSLRASRRILLVDGEIVDVEPDDEPPAAAAPQESVAANID